MGAPSPWPAILTPLAYSLASVCLLAFFVLRRESGERAMACALVLMLAALFITAGLRYVPAGVRTETNSTILDANTTRTVSTAVVVYAPNPHLALMWPGVLAAVALLLWSAAALLGGAGSGWEEA